VQESGRGKIYGSTSAGVVLFSVREDLPGGGELQISVWDYKTPRGRRLEGTGVAPDVKIEPTLADWRHAKDPVLETAIHDLQKHR
jgi:carboxyl-terminal processing protease